MGTGDTRGFIRATKRGRRAAVSTVLGVAVVAGALLFPMAAAADHDASDFFAFARAEYGQAAETNCDGSQHSQVYVSGSTLQIRGRVHSNADFDAPGSGVTFHDAVTYGSNDTDCLGTPGTNTYNSPGSPDDLDGADPPNVNDGWPGDLDSYLNADGLTFGDDIEQILGPGAECDVGDLATDGVDLDIDDDENGLVVCNGTGKVTLSAQSQTMSVTIVSHGAIVISGQGATLSPAEHGILAWTDQDSSSAAESIVVSGSNFTVPDKAILFAPRSGIDIGGSDDSSLCIQLIAQGKIKVQGSRSTFGPGSCEGPPPPQPQISVDKQPDSQNVNAGQPISFTIQVSSTGTGSAHNVQLTDNLPADAGLNWSESPDNPDCEINGALGAEVLTCDFGILDPGQTRTVTVTSPTDSNDCGTYDNTGSVTADGGLSDSDSGQVTVLCNGKITIVKDTVPNDGQNFTFTDNIPNCTVGPLDDDSNATLQNQVVCSNVAPGNYSVSETDPTSLGYTLTNLVCTDANSTENIGTRTASIVLDSGEELTCTFTNSENGSIEIRKDAQPNSAQDFAFTDDIPGCDIGTLDDDSNGTLDNDTECSNLPPGNYTVSENDPTSSGWALTGLTCDDSNSGENVGTRTASIVLDPGEELLCTFVNTQPPGTITIVKDAVPNSATDFGFNDNIPSCTIDDLDDDAVGPLSNSDTCSNVPAGQYTVSEDDPGSNWALTNLECSDDNSTENVGTRTATINLGPGETVTCTFTNTQKGSITIVKDTVPNSGTDFSFTSNIPGCTVGPLDDDGAGGSATLNQVTCSNVTSGQYTVSENDPSAAGYVLGNLVCSDANSTEDVGTRTATINLEPGESVTCTFTNSDQPSSIVVEKTADPTSVPEPGGNVTFTVVVKNTSVSDDVTFDQPSDFTDAVEGGAPATITDIDCNGGTAGNGLPLTLQENDNAPGGPDEVTCTFVKAVAGQGGDVIDDVVEVTGTDDDGNPVKDDDEASVTITDQPSSIVVEKTADPTSVPEPGGNVTFTVVVKNTSVSDDVTFDQPSDFTDAVEGGAPATITDIDCNGGTAGNGLPLTLQENDNAPGGPDEVTCTFVKAVAGQGGDVIDDVVEVTGTDDDGNPVKDDDEASVTITANPGTLKVIKTVLNGNGGTAVPADFEITVTGNNPSPSTFDGVAGPGGTDVTIGAGAYDVTEVEHPDYEATYSEDCSGTIALGETKTCTITNDDRPPKLTLKKVVVNNNGGTASASDWTLTADGSDVDLSGSGPTVTSDTSLRRGTYELSEQGPAGYDASAWDCVFDGQAEGTPGGDDDTVVLELGDEVTCTITNDDQAPTLKVIKTVVNDDGGSKVAGDFAITVTGNDPSPANFNGVEGPGGTDVALDAGAYDVTEVEDPGYAASYSAGCSGTIALGESKTCTITNDDKPAKLIVVKTVVNDDGGNAKAADFQMTIGGVTAVGGNSFPGAEAPGTEKTLSSVGAFTVTEVLIPGYTQTGAVGCSGTIALGETKTCTITNNDNPPQLQADGAISVVKTANPTSVKEPGGPVEFTVTVSNPSSVTILVQNVVDSVFGDLDDSGGIGLFDVPFTVTPGNGVSRTFTRNVTGTAGQVHINVVTATGWDGSKTLTASDDARVEITPRVIDLVMVKEASPTTVAVNGTFEYTLTVTNKGPDTATNVQVADPAPAGIVYIPPASTTKGTCNASASSLTCDLGSVAANETVTIRITARATTPGTHTNTATVTGGGGREANPADNTDTATVNVPAPQRPPTVQSKPKPAPVCLTLTVTPKMIKADGKVDRVTVKVTAGKKRVKGTKVSIFGAGVRKTTRSNKNGMAYLRINPKRAGLITITAIETNQRVCGPKRIGVVGVFLPPLTG